VAQQPVALPRLLDTRERRFGFAAAGLSVALGIIAAIQDSHQKVTKGHKTLHSAPPETLLIVGIAGGLIMLAATLWGRRLPFGIAAFLVGEGTALTVNLIFGLPFLALALWQILRFNKANRIRALARRQEAAANRSAGGSRSRTTPVPEIGRPHASKRYTPPKRRPSQGRERSVRPGAGGPRERSTRS
jgi:hypothetical protein